MNKTLFVAAIFCAHLIPANAAVSADFKSATDQTKIIQLAANGKSLPKKINSRDPLVRKHFGKNSAISTQDGVDQGRPCSFNGFKKKTEERCKEIKGSDGVTYEMCCQYVCSYSCNSQTEAPRGTPGGSFLGKQSGTCKQMAGACSATPKNAGSTSSLQTLGN